MKVIHHAALPAVRILLVRLTSQLLDCHTKFWWCDGGKSGGLAQICLSTPAHSQQSRDCQRVRCPDQPSVGAYE